MARKKEYIEEEVIEKAMELFWHNGYEATSVRMLEKAMGINQFSMYSSFGSKHGVFIESIKCYEKKGKSVFDKLDMSTKGIEGIKEFFYDTLKVSEDYTGIKGCLMMNTFNEFASSEDKEIKEVMSRFKTNLKGLFIKKLRDNDIKDEDLLIKQANYLFIAKKATSIAEKNESRKEIEDYIEMTFKNLL